ncbi:MAG: insulinase family protein [Rickettsiales bacterium]|nr:insulinase family protein [Rickettsiales bacterium]
MRWLVLVLLLLPRVAFATEVQEVVSAKGVTAWLVEDHSLPLVSVKLTFRDSGVAYDPKGKEGRAAMTAALLMEGAGKLDATQFSKSLESDAVRLAFGVDEDGFSASLSSIADVKDKAFSYLGMALNAPRFDAAAVARVREQTLSVLNQQEKDPNYLLSRKWAEVLFNGHPYGNPEMGTKESVAKLGAADAKDFVKRYLTRDALVVGVVGDITPAELSALLDAHLATLPDKAQRDVTLAEAVVPEVAQQAVVDSDIPQTMALFGTRGIKRDDVAFYDAYVMNYLLGGGALNSRLFVEIREKRGLTYGIYSHVMPLMHAGVWFGSFATRNDKMGEALGALRETLKRFAEEGPSDAELAAAKQYLTGSFVLGLDSNGEIANYLINMQLNNLGRDYLDKRNALMEAVTKEGVKAIARKLVDPKGLQVVMVGRPVLEEAKKP